MKTLLNRGFYFFMGIFFAALPTASQVAINTNGSAAAAGSILDLQSVSRGLLLPVLSEQQRLAIQNPVTSLLSFQPEGNSGLYWYGGSVWNKTLFPEAIPAPTWTNNDPHQYSSLSGNVGLGTNSPAAKLHLRENVAATGILLDGVNPIWQIRQGSAGTFNSIGFAQVDILDFRIGTNSINTEGKFILRNNGYNHLTVDANGILSFLDQAGAESGIMDPNIPGQFRVNSTGMMILDDEVYIDPALNRTGIGTSTPSARLEVNGNVKARGDLNIGGELNWEQTGSSVNLLPICHGTVNEAGTLVAGTSNISITLESPPGDPGRSYRVSCAGIGTSSIILLNPIRSSEAVSIAYEFREINNGDFLVRFYHNTDVLYTSGIKSTFSFSVINP